MTRFTELTLSTILSVGIAAAATAQETHPETGVELADDQTFTYRILDNISSVDPQIVEDTDGSDVVRDLFEGLLNQDENGELVPGVATDWEVSDDKMTYTFHLRDDAKWSNGDPVTAGDFVYAWRRAADPATASPYQWFISLMSLENGDAVVAGDAAPEELGVEAIDDRTLEVRLSAPLPYFPQMVVHSTTFPSPQKVIEEYGEAWTKPGNIVSNGAYVLTEMNPGESIVREKNPEYWDAENVILDKSVALIINDENVALTRYKAGELDMTDIPAGQFPRLKEEYGDEAHSFPKLCNYYYTFNLSDSGPEAFKDPKVRKALSLAVDRDIIVNNVMAGGQPPAYVFTPEATADFSAPDLEIMDMTQAERDEKARELLAEAGYGSDNPLSFDMVYNTSEAHEKVAVVLAQMWKQKLGVEVQLSNMEWKVFLEERGNQNFELARGAWCGDYNEASTFLDLLESSSGYNDGKYSNPEYDQLLEDALTAEDTTPLYTAAEEILAEDMPVIPLYHYAGVYMIDDDLKNFPVNNIQFNWYSKDLYKAAE
ncbi:MULTISPECIES: peptide ABC transporter substrate-binding protein [Salipiger]|jgi:oligopeptide transport system substrate-binding protein|uniref:Oligopeptide transport system substrate-binding protein n=1 Tax=Salipiger profundus TaxID=1229727 RepID=A0A1U7D8Z5_9RHOB|nr:MULTISPECIES: peptide ABC transporter substrate-binding protein [Salipiger]APX24644.1 oligopeptide transport system substrate-binding protein [Salipiger profundus]GFZ96752.1 peptide ABC transporter substrate-binding protein [Salipiger profundus]SFB80466.1 oligopeptide transport system substrate-binding protein [Salipiger profundus]